MKRVLICEDNPDLTLLIKMALGLERYEVDALASMRGLIDKVIGFDPDVILMDLRMPDIGGEEAVRMLRGDARTEGKRVILLSANARVGAIATELGLPYLHKPFAIKELRRVVAAAA